MSERGATLVSCPDPTRERVGSGHETSATLACQYLRFYSNLYNSFKITKRQYMPGLQNIDGDVHS